MRRRMIALHTTTVHRMLTARDRLQNDRGDVPGWVMVTMMTAGIVVVIWAVAGPMLRDMVVEALNGVTGP